MTDTENGKYGRGFQFRKHVDRTKWESFKRAIYDPSTKEFLGRTGKSWGQLLLFYAIFYAVLAALFAICMKGLLATLSDDKPKWTLDSSLIGTNPGLGFRPISDKPEDGSLIWYSLKNKTTIEKWTHLIDDFLEDYMANQTGGNFDSCDYDKKPEKNRVCKVDPSVFGECSKSKSPNYGYDRGSPCVFLKLNKIYGWEPKPFTTPQSGMPGDLNTTIKGLKELQRNQIWVSCNGERAYDKENVRTFSYQPPGFPGYYYPYTNTVNYLSPLVAVQILNPERNVLINIECRAWAENIEYVSGDLNRKGSVRFEILIDDPVEPQEGMRNDVLPLPTQEVPVTTRTSSTTGTSATTGASVAT